MIPTQSPVHSASGHTRFILICHCVTQNLVPGGHLFLNGDGKWAQLKPVKISFNVKLDIVKHCLYIVGYELVVFKHYLASKLVFYLLSWTPSHSTVFDLPNDLEAKSLGEIPSDFGCWLGDISVALKSLFIFRIFWNQYMWQYMVCFTTYLQRQPESSSLINQVFDAIGSNSIVYIVGRYGAAFSDVTIVLTRDVTIVSTMMHGDINNALLGKQKVRFKISQMTWVTWDRRTGQVTCQVTWLRIGDRKQAQDYIYRIMTSYFDRCLIRLFVYKHKRDVVVEWGSWGMKGIAAFWFAFRRLAYCWQLQESTQSAKPATQPNDVSCNYSVQMKKSIRCHIVHIWPRTIYFHISIRNYWTTTPQSSTVFVFFLSCVDKSVPRNA